MILANTGPSLAELRKKIGTKLTVEFNKERPIVMTVDAICAVGCLDLPIVLPDRTWTDEASVWYVTGSRQGKELEYDPTVVALVAFSATGRMTYAVLAIAGNENESAEVDTGMMLDRVFQALLISSIRGNSSG